MGKSTISMAIFNSYGMLNGTAGAMVTPGEHLAAAKRHSAELQAVVIWRAAVLVFPGHVEEILHQLVNGVSWLIHVYPSIYSVS